MFWSKKAKKPKLPSKMNLFKATAYISLKDGTTRTITREGGFIAFDFYTSGPDILDRYLVNEALIKRDDYGQYFPVNQIEKIDVKVEDFYVEHEE